MTLAGSQTPRQPAARPSELARLSDLREWHAMEAVCRQCRHVARLRPKQVMSMLSRRRRRSMADVRLVDLEHRLACRECGNRIDNTIKVVAIARD